MSLLTVADLLFDLCRTEIWRKIEGWPYRVSSWGAVRRIDTGRLLALADTKGYAHVSLSREGEIINFRVQKLVAEAFLGKAPFDGALVAHNDGDSGNNKANNLRWASALENQADRGRHGTEIYGSMVRNAKLTEADIPAIRGRIRAGEIYDSIGADYGVSKHTICLIKKGKIWKRAIAASEAA